MVVCASPTCCTYRLRRTQQEEPEEKDERCLVPVLLGRAPARHTPAGRRKMMNRTEDLLPPPTVNPLKAANSAAEQRPTRPWQTEREICPKHTQHVEGVVASGLPQQRPSPHRDNIQLVSTSICRWKEKTSLYAVDSSRSFLHAQRPSL